MQHLLKLKFKTNTYDYNLLELIMYLNGNQLFTFRNTGSQGPIRTVSLAKHSPKLWASIFEVCPNRDIRIIHTEIKLQEIKLDIILSRYVVFCYKNIQIAILYKNTT